MPSAPTKKQPIRVKLAFLGDMPLCVRYFFAEGNMLYNEENIMTPKERLRPVDKNALLFSILKSFFPGNWRMIRSTHIIDAPNVHAMPLTTAMIHPRVSLSRTMPPVFVSYAKTFRDTGTNTDVLQTTPLRYTKEKGKAQSLEILS